MDYLPPHDHAVYTVHYDQPDALFGASYGNTLHSSFVTGYPSSCYSTDGQLASPVYGVQQDHYSYARHPYADFKDAEDFYAKYGQVVNFPDSSENSGWTLHNRHEELRQEYLSSQGSCFSYNPQCYTMSPEAIACTASPEATIASPPSFTQAEEDLLSPTPSSPMDHFDCSISAPAPVLAADGTVPASPMVGLHRWDYMKASPSPERKLFPRPEDDLEPPHMTVPSQQMLLSFFEDPELESYPHDQPPMTPLPLPPGMTRVHYFTSRESTPPPSLAHAQWSQSVGHLQQNSRMGRQLDGQAEESAYHADDEHAQSAADMPWARLLPKSRGHQHSLDDDAPAAAHGQAHKHRHRFSPRPTIRYPSPRSASRMSSPPRKLLDKKPALACLFCRGRKIACGTPIPGSNDKTCTQCARRHLKCEYPKESRRGMRKCKDVSPSPPPSSVVGRSCHPCQLILPKRQMPACPESPGVECGKIIM